MKSKTKKRNYFSIVVCEAGDIDGYHVSVMDMDKQKCLQGSVLKAYLIGDTEKRLQNMIGLFVFELMGVKL